MSKRLELHDIFVGILGTEGQVETRVYFQPPTGFLMKYPCIVYHRGEIDTRTAYANNKLYRDMKAYTVTVIDPDPDSLIPDKVQKLRYSHFTRSFTNQNLNHDVFTIYY